MTPERRMEIAAAVRAAGDLLGPPSKSWILHAARQLLAEVERLEAERDAARGELAAASARAKALIPKHADVPES